jgi:hypothetical protein
MMNEPTLSIPIVKRLLEIDLSCNLVSAQSHRDSKAIIVPSQSAYIDLVGPNRAVLGRSEVKMEELLGLKRIQFPMENVDYSIDQFYHIRVYQSYRAPDGTEELMLAAKSHSFRIVFDMTNHEAPRDKLNGPYFGTSFYLRGDNGDMLFITDNGFLLQRGTDFGVVEGYELTDDDKKKLHKWLAHYDKLYMTDRVPNYNPLIIGLPERLTQSHSDRREGHGHDVVEEIAHAGEFLATLTETVVYAVKLATGPGK